MWRTIGLLGRDSLLSKEIIPRVRKGTGFVILGQHGIGKTAVLEWCYDHSPGRKAYVSATWTQTEIFREICVAWGLDIEDENGRSLPKHRWKIPLMENKILGERGHTLIVDDMQRATQSFIQKLKPMRDRFILIVAAVPPIKKEELKSMLWGLKYIELGPLKNASMERIGKDAAVMLHSRTPVTDAVHAARGIPSQLFRALQGEITPEAAKTKEEEIDISPIILIVFAGVMALRYVARGMGSTSLMLLSGLGMAGLVIARFYLFKGMRR